MNQIWWRINANNEIQNPKLKKEHEWIRNSKYYDSIINVIGKAIGDCVTGENEFAGDPKLGTVVFQNKDLKDYTPANWNAVVLYNYVLFKKVLAYNSDLWTTYDLEKLYGTDSYKMEMDQVIGNILVGYQLYCQNNGLGGYIPQLKRSLEQAREDIDKYNEAIGLDDKLNKLFITAKLYDNGNNKSSNERGKFLREYGISYFDAMCQAKECVAEALDLLNTTNGTRSTTEIFEDTVDYKTLIEKFNELHNRASGDRSSLLNRLSPTYSNDPIGSFMKDKTDLDKALTDITDALNEFSENKNLDTIIGACAYAMNNKEIARRYAAVKDKIKLFVNRKKYLQRIIPNFALNLFKKDWTLSPENSVAFLIAPKNTQLWIELKYKNKVSQGKRKLYINHLYKVKKKIEQIEERGDYTDAEGYPKSYTLTSYGCVRNLFWPRPEDKSYIKKLLEGLIDFD